MNYVAYYKSIYGWLGTIQIKNYKLVIPKLAPDLDNDKNDNQTEIKLNIEHLSNNFCDFKPVTFISGKFRHATPYQNKNNKTYENTNINNKLYKVAKHFLDSVTSPVPDSIRNNLFVVKYFSIASPYANKHSTDSVDSTWVDGGTTRKLKTCKQFTFTTLQYAYSANITFLRYKALLTHRRYDRTNKFTMDSSVLHYNLKKKIKLLKQNRNVGGKNELVKNDKYESLTTNQLTSIIKCPQKVCPSSWRIFGSIPVMHFQNI
ncbi:hypothetical protein QTP88_024144 [Uroleucon formosanum]